MIKQLKTALGYRLLNMALNLLDVPDGTRWNIAQVIQQVKKPNGIPTQDSVQSAPNEIVRFWDE